MKYGLNCGSGQRPFFSNEEITWLNVDVQVDAGGFEPDLIVDLKQPWDWADNWMARDFIVWHHCWEHEGCGEAEHFQRESHRVLKPGGSLLVFVPDMRALAQSWLLGKLDTQIYLTNVYGAYMGSEHDRHKWGYDAQTLEKELHRLPWAEVKPFDWRRIPGADCARAWWVLAMEAVK